MRSRSHLLISVLMCLAPILACATPARAQEEADRVMAAFVYRFPQFVEWPDSVLEGRETLDICVAEPDPFGAALESLIDGEVLNGRRLTARRVSSSGSLEGCHVLFISSVAQRATRLLQAADGRPILTIGESTDFMDSGGIINLRIVDRRVRFEVNTEAAARGGLRLSSQLLDLAIAVRSGPS